MRYDFRVRFLLVFAAGMDYMGLTSWYNDDIYMAIYSEYM